MSLKHPDAHDRGYKLTTFQPESQSQSKDRADEAQGDADEKMLVSDEYSSLPEVVPPPMTGGGHGYGHVNPYPFPHQHPSSTSPYLQADPRPGSSHRNAHTPLVSPLTPESTPLGHRPHNQPPAPWSPGYFENMNPVSLSSLQGGSGGPPLKPPPSYDYGEPVSPASSQVHLASGMYPLPGPPGQVDLSMMGGDGGVGGLTGPLGGGMLGPVAAARRRRRRQWMIAGGVCCLLLLCVVAGVVGILIGVVHINLRNNNGDELHVRSALGMVPRAAVGARWSVVEAGGGT